MQDQDTTLAFESEVLFQKGFVKPEAQHCHRDEIRLFGLTTSFVFVFTFSWQ